jgi:CDP-diacylglycerol--glycerol-3-phosphate 3-phosphatidyltransferase
MGNFREHQELCLFDGRFRSIVDKSVGPLGSALGRTGLTPDQLTALGLVMAVPAAFAIASGRLALGLALLILSSAPDLLDGALAKAKGTASVRGAFFDSVADRVTDAVVMGGVAWYLQSSRGGHAGLLPFAILGVSTLISYERAKAESLGFTAKGGLMERAERILLLMIGLLIPVILVPILWVMLTLTAVTALQRFVRVWRQATAAGSTSEALSASAAASARVASDEAPRRRAASAASGNGSASGVASPTLNGHGSGAGGPVSARPDESGSERWRSWRQQSSVPRSGSSGVSPMGSSRTPGIGRASDGPPGSTRWEERRAARLRTSAEGKGASRTPDGRRHGTRRP